MSLIEWQLFRLQCGHTRTTAVTARPYVDELYCGECLMFSVITHPVFNQDLNLYCNWD